MNNATPVLLASWHDNFRGGSLNVQVPKYNRALSLPNTRCLLPWEHDVKNGSAKFMAEWSVGHALGFSPRMLSQQLQVYIARGLSAV